jgi:chromosome segregation ATPase
MKITKIAETSYSDKRAIQGLEKDVKDLKRDIKGLEGDFKDLKKSIESVKKEISNLNIGKRQFYQHKTVFNSLQRKIERFETLEKEWVKYKEKMDKDLKKFVSKMDRARVTLK